jgi:hypothetical protein
MQELFGVVLGLALGVIPCGGAGAVPCPDKAKTLTVHFARTRGVGDFTGFPDLNLDARNLSTAEQTRLRRLIADARFFRLSSSPAPPPFIPDPPAGYDLSVEMDGRAHTVWVTDGDVTPSLQPLIQWLTDRARKAGAE